MSSNQGGAKDLRRIPVENAWREFLRRHNSAQENFSKNRTFAAQRTIQNWTSRTLECAVPEMAALRGIETELNYPLVQQLVDLGLVSPDEVQVGITALPASTSLVLARLDMAVATLTSNRYDVWDLARYVIDDCVRTGSPGRWRARVFDVPSGETLRHGAYRAVEFLRSRLPDTAVLGSRGDTQQTERICLELAPDCGTWADLVEFKLAQDGGNRAHWLERLELVTRMRRIRDSMVLNTYGGEGSLHLPLLNNPDRKQRHIFVDVDGARRAHDPREMTGINTTLRAKPRSGRPAPGGKVLVIGPPSINNLALSRMAAGALGWPAQTIREHASAAGASRLRVTAREPDTAQISQTIEHIAAWRPVHPAIISLSSLPSAAKEITTLRKLLNDEFTVPVFVRPSRDLLEEWEQRQRKGTDGMSKNSRSDAVVEALDAISEILKGRKAPYLTARIRRPDAELLPWSKDEHFVHPSIGDFTVRAAYQLAYALTHGEIPPKGPARVTRFMPGSVLDRHEASLRSSREGNRRPLVVQINRKVDP